VCQTVDLRFRCHVGLVEIECILTSMAEFEDSGYGLIQIGP
jgi:hypothetical protein